MQTAKIIPLQTKSLQLISDNNLLGITPAQWIFPGRLITIAPGIHATVAYDQTDGEYTTRFKFWYGGQRTKDYHFDKNHQIDLKYSCQRIITLLATRSDPSTGRPHKTLIEVSHHIYSWQKP